MSNKIKSFTLAELVVVMIITAIVVGMAFSVLRLVQKQISSIKKNYEKSTNLSLFEQKIWQDFNEFPEISFNKAANRLILKSEVDTVQYVFNDDFTLRDKDTIKLKLVVDKFQFQGKPINNDGAIDAMTISAESELPNYRVFVFKKNDVTLFMNEEDGF